MNSIFTVQMPRDLFPTPQLVEGWSIMAASTPSQKPLSAMMTLLPALGPCPSSAGVPTTSTSPARSPIALLAAIPAPTAEAAMRLWPQPCPTPGRASYSARTATLGPFPLPLWVAQKAVGIP